MDCSDIHFLKSRNLYDHLHCCKCKLIVSENFSYICTAGHHTCTLCALSGSYCHYMEKEDEETDDQEINKPKPKCRSMTFKIRTPLFMQLFAKEVLRGMFVPAEDEEEQKLNRILALRGMTRDPEITNQIARFNEELRNEAVEDSNVEDNTATSGVEPEFDETVNEELGENVLEVPPEAETDEGDSDDDGCSSTSTITVCSNGERYQQVVESRDEEYHEDPTPTEMEVEVPQPPPPSTSAPEDAKRNEEGEEEPEVDVKDNSTRIHFENNEEPSQGTGGLEDAEAVDKIKIENHKQGEEGDENIEPEPPKPSRITADNVTDAEFKEIFESSSNEEKKKFMIQASEKHPDDRVTAMMYMKSLLISQFNKKMALNTEGKGSN